MTRDEAIKIILQRLGNRVNDTYLQQVAVSEMQLAQEMALEGADFKPWFLLSENMFANTGVLEPRIPVPPGFLEEHEDGTLWVQQIGTTKWLPLAHGDADVLEERYEGLIGIPQEYAVVRHYFVLFPKPDVAYPLKMRCFLREPALVYPYGEENLQSTRTNNWLMEAADWLIGETGRAMAASIRDQEALLGFEKTAAEGRTRLYVRHVAREEMNRTRSQGDD